MIPRIFNLNRELNFRNRRKDNFQNHDFLHKEVFLNHLDSLDMIIMDMPHITFINVPEYFINLSDTQRFLKKKNNTHLNVINRDSENFPSHIQEQSAIVALLCCNTINDLVGFLIQIKNALAPDGLFIGSFIGDHVVQNVKNSFAHAELDITGQMKQRFHPVIDIKQIGMLLQRAEFSLPLTNLDTYSVRYKNSMSLIQDIRGMGYSYSLNESNVSLRRDVLFKALENLQEILNDAPMAIDIITAIARRHSHQQQKALLPGSAMISLKDVL